MISTIAFLLMLSQKVVLNKKIREAESSSPAIAGDELPFRITSELRQSQINFKSIQKYTSFLFPRAASESKMRFKHHRVVMSARHICSPLVARRRPIPGGLGVDVPIDVHHHLPLLIPPLQPTISPSPPFTHHSRSHVMTRCILQLANSSTTQPFLRFSLPFQSIG